MAEGKLKSCPFCGGEATIDKTTHGSRTDIMYINWRVRCKSCGANIEKSADNSCGRKAYTEDEMIAIWNERR